MANIYITVENAGAVLNNLKSLNRPLTAEEKLAGRKAALLRGDELHSQAVASANSLRDMEIKFYMKQGYTENEAREQLRLDDFAHAEAIGLGSSKKCHWRNRNKMLRAMAHAN